MADRSLLPEVKPDWKPSKERTSRNVIAISLACVLAFVLGVVIQQGVQGPDGFVELFKKCVLDGAAPALCQAAIETQHEQGHSFVGVNLWLALAETLKALGIALIVSLFISSYFERRSRDRLNAALAEKAQQLSTNVFDAMFGNSHPPSALDTIKRILERPLTREQFDVTYTLTSWAGKKGSRIEGQKYVMVEANLSAITRNIADPKISPSADYPLPIAVSLPNPLIDELKPLVKFKSVKLNGEDISPEALKRANQDLQKGLENDEGADALVKFCDYNLKPGERVRVQASYVMMKEFEDTEVLRSFQMCQSLTLTVIDKTGADLAIHARGIHPGKLDVAGESASFLRWELNDIILPQQGIMVWWKKRLASVPAPAKGNPGGGTRPEN